MWWEAVPSLAIVGIAMGLPQIFAPLTNLFFLGTMHKRELFYFSDATMYLRDTRLTGNPYKQNNLDCCDFSDVPLEESKK